jgi:dTDP-4-dehydrorhamnose 3,5-epimerase
MRVTRLDVADAFVVEPRVLRDARGAFVELWHEDGYTSIGLRESFVQDNISVSRKGVLRGLHYQHPDGQAKLVTAVYGTIYDVAVDLRVGSPTFGRWAGVELNSDNMRQFYVPAGFAHGFAVMSELAIVAYKCSAYYAPSCDHAVRWDDPDLAIDWPVAAPLVSARDAGAAFLRDVPQSRLPRYGSVHAPVQPVAAASQETGD